MSQPNEITFQLISKERISTLKCKTDNINEILKKITEDKLKCKQVKMTVHGDNLDKYIQQIKEVLHVSLLTDTTLTPTALGSCFLLQNILNEVFEYKSNELFTFPEANDGNIYPFLLVIINYKIVFIKVSSKCTSEKVYEAPFNCEFLLKIARVSFGIKTLESFFAIASKFNKKDSKQELGVEDTDTYQTENTITDKEDLAVSLLQSLLENLCDLILLQTNNHNIYKVKKYLKREYFNNDVFLDIFVKYFERFSENKINVYFMRHNGLSTSIGTLIKDNSTLGFDNSWWENYSISSGLIKGDEDERKNFITSYLALDSVSSKLVPFPLLKQPYRPYFQDLYGNKRIRDYWVDCVVDTVKFSAESRVKKDPTGKLATIYPAVSKLLTEKLNFLGRHPYAYGPLSFGIIQDIIFQLSLEFGVFNSSYKVKTNEIKAAMNYLPKWLTYFDGLPTNERHTEIAKSLLAGNMFDWGSKEINLLFLANSLDFRLALKKLSGRPWPKDDLDLWLQRMNEPAHKFAAIFPDNCGFDFILGIIPFARELIKRGTKVVLCVNVEPVLNDVTVYEVKYILDEISKICPIIGNAYKTNQLFISKHSRCSTCLDLRYVNHEFAELSPELDLLMIDGMGRSIHTNFDAEYQIECLKVATIKDNWLSKEITGQEFAAIFSYSRVKQ
uniref:4'-phosphopantetheine phosphatase n=1 Tax=Rhodnius prolixus TaxID=13249 RepID=T1HMW0_RHOPR